MANSLTDTIYNNCCHYNNLHKSNSSQANQSVSSTAATTERHSNNCSAQEQSYSKTKTILSPEIMLRSPAGLVAADNWSDSSKSVSFKIPRLIRSSLVLRTDICLSMAANTKYVVKTLCVIAYVVRMSNDDRFISQKQLQHPSMRKCSVRSAQITIIYLSFTHTHTTNSENTTEY